MWQFRSAKILALPDAAWINKPNNQDDQQTYQPAAGHPLASFMRGLTLVRGHADSSIC